MAATRVNLTADAYMVCLTHALSTEREEVMGLCIGEIDTDKVVHIVSVIILRRSDKRKDRVEISPEQLSFAASEGEISFHKCLSNHFWVLEGNFMPYRVLAALLKRPLRVVGWYHSHPHITVWPSHVDVQTQSSYQLLDECFVGLIFSCFNEDKASRQGQIQVTCFQSINQSPEGEAPMYERVEIPLEVMQCDSISPSCMDALVQLPKILSQEEQEAYENAIRAGNGDLLNNIHNGAVYTKAICHLLEVMSGSLLQALEQRLNRNEDIIERLVAERERLMKQLEPTS
ncbi:putative lys-63-specific deubiquitinase BRCC36 isoform X2 [Apostichopus japonicus]|uniref:Putative lys-63-specific deubiquitinase BRCC36 isoform X2 n=1 Tax=Stichopus japonicus TaxID=307972 RepID=A0A2G8LBW4_STIJA|nr:putative lys-63-specific deubiquitinase BRCC36 isoform X2 [Apostichopus japonicus]